jgi:hypothetical protein
MATEGTRFETISPDGDKVEVVVTKVLNNVYNIEFSEVDICAEFENIEEAKMFKDEVYKTIYKMAQEHNGYVTTGSEEVYKQS